GGGSEEKPVGTVCFAFADNQSWQQVETMHFTGDRAQVRKKAVEHALTQLHQHLL
ncbi:damage-inducible protein CinA, partial [Vibrio campbellii]